MGKETKETKLKESVVHRDYKWAKENRVLQNARNVENQARMAEIAAEKDKRSMFASPFESLGMAIAKGLLDSNGGISAEGRAPTKRKRSGHRLEVGEGESGVTECPECGEPVAIAPTARSAVCSSCDATFPITRVPNKEE